MAELGHDVLGIDIDAAKIEMLREGRPVVRSGAGRTLGSEPRIGTTAFQYVLHRCCGIRRPSSMRSPKFVRPPEPPKDIRAFAARAGELGVYQALSFLREVDCINMRRRTKVVELGAEACGGSLLGMNVAVLGAAFTPESDDIRDSPALNVAGMMQLHGAAVSVYGPKAMANSRNLFPALDYATSTSGACKNADVVLVATKWAEFVALDPGELDSAFRTRVWRSAGWTYRGLGR